MLYTIKGMDAGGARIAFQAEAADDAVAAALGAARGLTDVTVSAIPAIPPAAPIALGYQTPLETGINLRNRWLVMLIFLGVECLCLMGLFGLLLIKWGANLSELLVIALTGMIYIVLQLGIMVPVLRPRATGNQPKAAWRWLSALSLGVVFGVLVFCGLLLVTDLIWATNPDLDNDFLSRMVIAALFLTGGSWLVTAPLVYLFMRKRPPESVLAKLSASLFLGSVVEFIAGVPIVALAQRRDSCWCAHASFWSMVLSATNATLVLGPMVFLIILARRTRAISRGRCAACGFDLRPLVDKDRCPNCGAGWKTAA